MGTSDIIKSIRAGISQALEAQDIIQDQTIAKAEEAIGDWEKFEWYDLGGGYIGLQDNNNKYIEI